MIKDTTEKKQNLKSLHIYSVIILIIVIAATIYLSIKDIRKTPLCNKYSCMNLDARNQKCDIDVKTIIKEKFRETTIELRYSAKCDAAWSKGVVPPGSILYVKDAQGKKYGYYNLDGKPVLVLNDGIPSAHYGNMGPGKNLKACVQLPDNKHLCTKLAD